MMSFLFCTSSGILKPRPKVAKPFKWVPSMNRGTYRRSLQRSLLVLIQGAWKRLLIYQRMGEIPSVLFLYPISLTSGSPEKSYFGVGSSDSSNSESPHVPKTLTDGKIPLQKGVLWSQESRTKFYCPFFFFSLLFCCVAPEMGIVTKVNGRVR